MSTESNNKSTVESNVYTLVNKDGSFESVPMISPQQQQNFYKLEESLNNFLENNPADLIRKDKKITSIKKDELYGLARGFTSEMNNIVENLKIYFYLPESSYKMIMENFENSIEFTIDDIQIAERVYSRLLQSNHLKDDEGKFSERINVIECNPVELQELYSQCKKIKAKGLVESKLLVKVIKELAMTMGESSYESNKIIEHNKYVHNILNEWVVGMGE